MPSGNARTSVYRDGRQFPVQYLKFKKAKQLMAAHARVLNVTSQLRIKRSQAIGRIAHCVSEWVEPGLSIRDLSPRERIIKRSQMSEGEIVTSALPEIELPGITFKPPIGAQAAHYLEQQRAFEADKFYTQAVQ